VYVAGDTCLSGRCLATTFSSSCTIPAFQLPYHNMKPTQNKFPVKTNIKVRNNGEIRKSILLLVKF
jgi:hypothetical protein